MAKASFEDRANEARMKLITAREAQYAEWKKSGYKGRSINRVRPYVIEFCGTPKSGKTTMKEMLKHFFRREDWGVSAPEEGAEAVKWARDEPWYNFSTTEYALGHLRQEFYGTNDVILLDRALMDGVVRMEHYRENGRMDEEEWQTVHNYYMLKWNSFAFDQHVFLVADANIAIQRELSRVLTQKHGQTMNPKSLAALLASHERVWQEQDGDHQAHMTWHDSSNEDEHQTAGAIMNAVLTSFENRDFSTPFPEGMRLRG